MSETTTPEAGPCECGERVTRPPSPQPWDHRETCAHYRPAPAGAAVDYASALPPADFLTVLAMHLREYLSTGRARFIDEDARTLDAIAASLAPAPAAGVAGGGDDGMDENDVLQVLCRVFDDGADAAMEEWRAWYQPAEWLHRARAVGAFIRQRLDARAAAPGTATELHSARLVVAIARALTAEPPRHDQAVLLERLRTEVARHDAARRATEEVRADG